mmetsp:Transcript_97985/g.204401  ORF Transcript_97985/g.204401 Transcript_97985/m.204401 type:complete len:340 (-) Transcript_97985:152-1171(-)
MANVGSGSGPSVPRKTSSSSIPSKPVTHAAVKKASWKEIIKEFAVVFATGVLDSVALHRCVIFLVKSETIRSRTLQCMMLNGVIFLGSIMLFSWVIEPALRGMRSLVPEEEAWVADWMGSFFSTMYQVLWIYPIYCISFVLNTVMYQEIADSALSLRKAKVSKSGPLLDRLMNEVFRLLLNVVYIIEINLMSYLPRIGNPLFFIHSCWLGSIYCFEYRWVHLRWTSNERLECFEGHWVYFFGFGFPISLLTFFCPRFVDSGVFALFFPLCIMTAIAAEPKPLKLAPTFLKRLPVFAVVQGVSCVLLKVFEGQLGGGSVAKTQSQPTRHTSSSSVTMEKG